MPAVPLVLLGLLILWQLDALYHFAFLPEAGYGGDFLMYRAAAESWLAGGSFYQPVQLAGHYQILAIYHAILYPPVILWLLVPFVFLPAWLWWVIPSTAIVFALWRLRPAVWAWCVMLAIFAFWPRAPQLFLWGNPAIWAIAALFLGTIWPWASALVLLKPTLLPFALFGMHDRRWWLTVGTGVLASLPLGALWFDYVRALANSDGTITYSLADMPALCVPVVAWLGRTRPGASARAVRFQSLVDVSRALRRAREEAASR